MTNKDLLLEKLTANLDFDLDALREKYVHERDRRINTAGTQQYAEVSGDLAKFEQEDPYVETPLNRSPVSIETDVVIVGAGFSGLMAGARLTERGVTDFRIIDAAADFGGTWYWNRYPGAQCDIDAYCYLPLLEETGYMPKEKYSFAPEIFEHSKRIADYFDLYDRALFQTRVTELRWLEEESRWKVSTNRGDDIRARFVIQGTGPLSRPKLPGIPGINRFKGHTFHTCRWDYNYTGGTHKGGMNKLADKRVAIIGTGATAIQCVPFLGESVKELYVFQRTPSSVGLRGNKPTDESWYQSLEAGWQRKRRENFSAILQGEPAAEDLVADGWTDIVRRLGNALMSRDPSDGDLNLDEIMLRSEIADFEKMNELRGRIEEIVKDTETAEKLKPWYRQFCKRPTFNDQYLDTFNRPNVHLVDTSDTQGVERVTEKGLVSGDVEYEVDCIVFATGFEATSAPHRRVDFTTVGRHDTSLFDYWKDGFRTLHGISSHNFPNWFTIGINQNALSPNFTSMFDDLAIHVSYIIAQVLKSAHQTVEVSPEAEEAWVQEIIRTTNHARNDFLAECTPGFFNHEGQAENLQNLPYGPGINAFNALLAEWREDGELKGMILS
ncbi:MAG: NAD(P)/FAD-dependent oxidoreductase [Pseudomonadota bacterium]